MPWLLLAGAVAVGIVLVGRASSSSPGAARSWRTWTTSQVDSAMRTTVLAHGYPETVYQALRANAYAESTLDPWAVGDKGNAVGLYQISYTDPPIRVTGYGMLPILPVDPARSSSHLGWQYGTPDPLDPRADPVKSTEIMLAAIANNATITALINAGQPASLLAAEICVLIERPANSASAAEIRAGYVEDWFA